MKVTQATQLMKMYSHLDVLDEVNVVEREVYPQDEMIMPMCSKTLCCLKELGLL